MASVTTYLQAVNAVLRAANAPSVSATVFAAPDGEPNSREVKAAKEIVLEVYEEFQNDRPDSFWQRSSELTLYKPHQLGGVVQIASGTPTQVDFSADADLDTIPWLALPNPTNATDSMLHINGERQYYRMTLRQSDTRVILESPNIEYVGYNDPTAPLAYSIFRYLYPLPADFRDVLNVYNPYVGSDLRPAGPERLIEVISEHGYVVTTTGGGTGWGADPEFYGIWRTNTGVPKLVVHPLPAQDRVLTLRYQKMLTRPTQATDTFDVDEDLFKGILLNRMKARAAAELLGDVGMVQLYENWAKRGQDNAQQKSMEAGGEFMRIRPATGEDYRNFYGSARTRDQRRIFLRR